MDKPVKIHLITSTGGYATVNNDEAATVIEMVGFRRCTKEEYLKQQRKVFELENQK